MLAIPFVLIGLAVVAYAYRTGRTRLWVALLNLATGFSLAFTRAAPVIHSLLAFLVGLTHLTT